MFDNIPADILSGSKQYDGNEFCLVGNRFILRWLVDALKSGKAFWMTPDKLVNF